MPDADASAAYFDAWKAGVVDTMMGMPASSADLTSDSVTGSIIVILASSMWLIHCTTSSARSAPAALTACRMEITSRVLTRMRASACTRSPTVF